MLSPVFFGGRSRGGAFVGRSDPVEVRLETEVVLDEVGSFIYSYSWVCCHLEEGLGSL